MDSYYLLHSLFARLVGVMIHAGPSYMLYSTLEDERLCIVILKRKLRDG